jgi:hypothetical protein
MNAGKRIALGAALVATISCSSPVAWAQATASGAEPVRLTWERAPDAESCPDASVIEADVTRRLGESPFRPDATDSIDVHVTREQGEWNALIEERSGNGPPLGSRVVTSAADSCDSLALAVGLAIALMIRARASSEGVDPAQAAPKAPPPAPPPPPCPDCPKPKSPDDERHVAAFASVVGALGVLPRAALGAALSGRVPVAEHASFLASLTWLPEQKTTGTSAETAFGATFGGLSGCYDTKNVARFRFSACASVLLGALHVIVWDPTPVRPGASFWSAGSLGLRADFMLARPLHLLVGVDGFVPFKRHTYVVDDAGGVETAFEQPAWGGLVSAGLGVEL